MHRFMKHGMTKKGAGVVAGALAATGLGATMASAETEEVVLGPDDLDTSETRATGHVDFLPHGLHVWTEGSTSTDKAAGYFELDRPLADIVTSSMTWYGTSPQPGQQVVLDADGDDATTDDRGILVGEPVYGDDWWLTGSSSATLKDGAPSTAGGSGSEWHGTLEQWSEEFPDAQALYGGFSLGSGVKGDGVIERITFGDTDYTFSNVEQPAEPAPTETPTETPTESPSESPTDTPSTDPTAVTGSSTRSVEGTFVTLRFHSDAGPGNAVGDPLVWKVKVDGDKVFRTTQGYDEHDLWANRFEPGSGKHRVKVFMDGDKVRDFVVRTGR